MESDLRQQMHFLREGAKVAVAASSEKTNGDGSREVKRRFIRMQKW